MDKQQAIKEAQEARQASHDKAFQDKVETLLYNIGEASDKLSRLKKELSTLEHSKLDDIQV